MKLKQLKIFLTKIRPVVSLMKVPLVRLKGLTKQRGVPFFDRWRMFPSKRLVFFTKSFNIPTYFYWKERIALRPSSNISFILHVFWRPPPRLVDYILPRHSGDFQKFFAHSFFLYTFPFSYVHVPCSLHMHIPFCYYRRLPLLRPPRPAVPCPTPHTCAMSTSAAPEGRY